MREKLELKLKELQVGQAQAQANLHAYGGAIQVVEQLIAELPVEEKNASAPVAS